MTTPEDSSVLKIVLKSSHVNEETILTKTLGAKGSKNNLAFKVNWDYQKLKDLDQPGNVNLSFECYINDKLIDTKYLMMSYRSINECVWGERQSDGSVLVFPWMFVGYVNEDHPLIDTILRQALNTGIVGSFSGYQSNNRDKVVGQVFAVWYALQKRRIQYSNITDTSNPTDRVLSQYVRFFEQTYNSSQANCVDGTVFLASILRKIGLLPFLVLEPGHMYLGIYSDKGKTDEFFVETTKIGDIDLSAIHESNNTAYFNGYGRYISSDVESSYKQGNATIEDLRKNISWNHFRESSIQRKDEFTKNASKFNDESDYRYQTIDVDLARKIVQPIK